MYEVQSTRYQVPSEVPFELAHESPLLHSSIGVRHSALKEYQVTSILSADRQASSKTLREARAEITLYQVPACGRQAKYNVPSRLRTSMLLHTLYFVQKKALRITSKGFNNVAATYSPGCNPSTIGAAGLNFSVRDGKRWDPCARPPKL